MRAFVPAATLATTLTLLSSVALAQPGGMGSTPMAVDLRKAKVGSWAEYTMTMGPRTMKMKWAFVGRDADSNTLEMTVDGGPAAMNGKMTMKMVLVPDPTSSDKPVKQLVMQPPNGGDPMELPLDSPQIPHQKFVKPDPKDLVGKETLKLASGTYKTSHYRQTNPQGTLDTWVSDTIPPLGVIKLEADAKAPPGAPPAQAPGKLVLELTNKGTGAKATVTKPAKPMNMGAMGMPGGPHGPPPGAPPPPPPGAAPSAPPPAPPPAK